MKTYSKAILFSITILVLTDRVLFAGDFLQTPNAIQPPAYNESGMPDYSSSWDPKLESRITEAIGEEGAQHYAEKMGWEKILTAQDKSEYEIGRKNQGPDQIWRDPQSGNLIGVEAKGVKYGTNYTLGEGYGHPQGSVEWYLEWARATYNDPTASPEAKQKAEMVLQHISEGTFDTAVIETEHYQGKPYGTKRDRYGETPDEYKGKSIEDLLTMEIPRGNKPEIYNNGDDPNMIKYGSEADREMIRRGAGDEKRKKEELKRGKTDQANPEAAHPGENGRPPVVSKSDEEITTKPENSSDLQKPRIKERGGRSRPRSRSRRGGTKFRFKY